MPIRNALDRLRALTVADVMNKQVIAVGSRDSMVDVAQTFLEHDISSAPVTDEQGRFVGILSATDFLRRDSEVSDSDVTPSMSGRGLQVRVCQPDTASAYMTEEVLTVSPQTPLIQAATIMTEHHLHRLPVLDARQRVAGVISTMDITAAVVNMVDEWGLKL